MTAQEFKGIVISQQATMYRVALRITGNHDDACDALQDTLVRLWSNRDKLDCAEDRIAYCVGSLKKQCISLLRSRKEFCGTEVLVNEESDISAADTLTEQRDMLSVVRVAIRSLPDSQRRVMELSVFSQCDNSEIHEITGMTEVNIRAALSRGRKRIREIFSNISNINDNEHH